MEFICLLILFPNFCEKFEVFVSCSYSLGDGRPEFSCKVSDRSYRVRADNGSVGHGLNGSTNRDGSHGSRVSTRDSLTHD